MRTRRLFPRILVSKVRVAGVEVRRPSDFETDVDFDEDT